MEWIPKILIAVAATNTFGAINYYLKSIGVVIEHHRVIKYFILLSAYLIAISAYRPNSVAVVISYIILGLGLMVAVIAICAGAIVGVKFTLMFGIFWLLAFSCGIYLFYRQHKELEVRNA